MTAAWRENLKRDRPLLASPSSELVCRCGKEGESSVLVLLEVMGQGDARRADAGGGSWAHRRHEGFGAFA